MIPFPLFKTSAKLTLSPGLPSKSVISGIESPSLTILTVVDVKVLVVVVVKRVADLVIVKVGLRTRENICERMKEGNWPRGCLCLDRQSTSETLAMINQEMAEAESHGRLACKVLRTQVCEQSRSNRW